jgi:hypothetical protein
LGLPASEKNVARGPFISSCKYATVEVRAGASAKDKLSVARPYPVLGGDPMKLGTPYQLKIVPINGKKRFQFLLWFDERIQPVEFETSADAAMLIMKSLQHLQARHKLAIPQDPTKKRGKPILSIVKSDD